MVDGILYPTAPDHVWALDARDGRQLWHYYWKTTRRNAYRATAASASGATTSSSKRRTTTLSRSTLKTGKERWHVEIADFDQQYFSTMAPMIVGDHVHRRYG